jgi:hypothetical protein
MMAENEIACDRAKPAVEASKRGPYTRNAGRDQFPGQPVIKRSSPLTSQRCGKQATEHVDADCGSA